MRAPGANYFGTQKSLVLARNNLLLASHDLVPWGATFGVQPGDSNSEIWESGSDRGV